MPAAIRPDVVRKFDAMLGRGEAISVSARECGVSYAWAKERAKGRKKRDMAKFYAIEREMDQPPVAAASTLSADARRALDDFEFFRRRYIGKESMPWQVDAANQVLELLKTPQREFVVINVPPGSGKSTLFTHDLVLWLICRNRAIRCLIGSAGERLAKSYTGRLMDSLERQNPYRATENEVRAGAHDADATVTGDYGRFKPTQAKVWRREEMTVAQPNDEAASDKEATIAAFGKDGGVLGGRFDLVIWDDLVTQRNQRTAESREEMKQWWKDTAESRLEPGGVLLLVGQRLGSDDLYRFALDMTDVVLDEDGVEVDVPADEQPRKYRHIIYRAHYEDLCDGKHPKGMGAWPNGCLLDPHRLPWRDLVRVQRNGLDSYLVVYQQEDTDPANVLVQKLWVTGGRDEHGVEHPGCWDVDRKVWELPRGLDGPCFVYATADPSPSKFWSVQAWAYHPPTEQRFLLDLVRQKMQAPELLDWDAANACFTGLMHEWQERSRGLGIPIQYWIVERNAAQRFLLQFDHVQRWLRLQGGVQLVGHDTHGVNRSDKDYGVQSLGPLYRSGRVRLPGYPFDNSRVASMKLVDEVTRWPEGSTDDCVMAQWFGEWQLPKLYVDPEASNVVRFRPSFMRQRVAS